ncbi:excinuclease ABC subunit UvrB [Mycoplasma phocimorsus]|uniref:UvrABC system protein B n=1 Tax=Mycoplasma phocimorsus TaxID=3045839 RepID=A0AAJ1UVS1_9MOLU|nr:excinuclease ABC subunit UvrB [Mycoplasma phocimorsus]MDJ1645839.1 excinuclease ABC subunit UvrB [Mycoplasma phocimorsus]MDJ1647007.1 excinuclease ABC subunit UvrB [Mycoplasma phocimorsus]MDJ1648014.1 excinuclease ABC subunit UvrB [Mycoplasma phocimorsus]MDJ1649129.1 excinuclease ABC subunit UvrB [Mycoplasma phocimorsus]
MKSYKEFELISDFDVAGDQQRTIEIVNNNLKNGENDQVIKGVTGSGKTFIMANIIKSQKQPVLIMSHNKTLASQLYNDIKNFFPNNKVEYYVSNFDFYMPEAYNPTTQVYIDKSSSINEELDAMRMASINSLLTRSDTIVVSSVACIYGTFNPNEYDKQIISIAVNEEIKIKELARKLVNLNYQRNQITYKYGSFRIKGDIVEIVPADNKQKIIQISFFGDEIEFINLIDVDSKKVVKRFKTIRIFPANAYVLNYEKTLVAADKIEQELEQVHQIFLEKEDYIKAQRILERTKKDLDDLRETGICKGMENYSRYFDGREEGEKPYTLLDYFPKNSLFIIDESHISMGQIRGMYNGDRTRKENLVNYGYRLPSALDNRPLKFDEFNTYDFKKVYVSATPGEYEINKSNGLVSEIINRPTGLLDPEITIVSSNNLYKKIYDNVINQIKKNERTLIITITKKSAEELSKKLKSQGIKVMYIHGDHNAIERHEILIKLRKGIFDVVVGINLLREGIDAPEVSLVMILDADATSFLRDSNSLIQLAGRAARNVNGRVIFFADKITKHMQDCIDDNLRKRSIQIDYNKKHNITPTTVVKSIHESLSLVDLVEITKESTKNENAETLALIIEEMEEKMKVAAAKKDFETAIKYRDKLKMLKG